MGEEERRVSLDNEVKGTAGQLEKREECGIGSFTHFP